MWNLTDHFLVAMPNLHGDNLFGGSVVYVTNHSIEQGAVGVIINKPLGNSLQNVFKDVDFAEYNPKWSNNLLYLGGPVSSDNGFVLHRTAQNQGNEILFELSNSKEVLSEIAHGNDKDNLFVSVGYAAWGASQIEEEICKNDWLVVKADSSLIFDVDVGNRYQAALRHLGITDPSRLYYGEDIIA